MHMAAKKKFTGKVEQIADAEFTGIYGDCWAASCSDGWESGKRSSEQRAQAALDAHLAVVNADETEAAADEPAAEAE
jgi:hypothetical protein